MFQVGDFVGFRNTGDWNLDIKSGQIIGTYGDQVMPGKTFIVLLGGFHEWDEYNGNRAIVISSSCLSKRTHR